ncbi:MAG: MBOAT family protein [Myxococcota bacterium]|nr:MBOAT family protein [Myxococcota bacterium]
MQFHSFEYAVLLLVAMACAHGLAKARRARTLVLLLLSSIFYGYWSSKYLVLIFGTATSDFLIARSMHRASFARRRALLLTSLTIDLGILCVFKYFNFFYSEVTAGLSALGMTVSPWALNVLLPVGISFYTFQSLSYVVDVYRGDMKPTKRWTEYLLYVAFFPQLVAGPIVRAKELLPQLSEGGALTAEQGSTAILRIAMGLAKKTLIADTLGAHLVDPVFSSPQMYSAVETLAACYGYAFQIYADFSAYSDIAIGSAALLGVRIPENFATPYLAQSPREFWRRWHISLSTWLRDYLYIPLGGSAGNEPRTCVNLMVTMLLGGLWHGASMTFVAWGAIHGLAIVAQRGLSHFFPKRPQRSRAWRVVGVVLTFHIVTAAWVLFRAPSFEIASEIFAGLASLDFGTANLSTVALLALLLGIASHLLPDSVLEQIKRAFHRLPAFAQALLVVALLWGLEETSRTELAPFIYFQF